LLRKVEEEIPDEQKNVENRIKELMEIEQADELQRQYDELVKMCNDILGKKNSIINEFIKELNYKDQQYVYSLKNFRKNIELIIELMRRQFIETRTQKLDHLNLIEDQFSNDRSQLIEDYKKNIQNLISKLQSAEDANERKLKNTEDDQEREAENEAYKLEMDFINKVLKMEKYYNYLKEQIEDHTYDLKIQLERLDYRVEVRQEKIKEDKEKDKVYTKKLEKLRERIHDYEKKYAKNNKLNNYKNMQLKDDFKKMTRSFNDLKKKFEHFEIYDDLTFNSIYKMNSEEVISTLT
jgi:hypothetical protein